MRPPVAPGPGPGPGAVVGISVAALAASAFALVSVGVLAPEIGPALDLSKAAIGAYPALFALGGVVTARYAGTLTDRWGPARIMGVALAGAGIAIGLLALAARPWAMFAAAFVVGGFCASVSPATNVIVAGSMARRLGLFLSVKQSGVPLGTLVAGLTLPAIAAAIGWRGGIAVTAVLLLAVAAATPLVRGAAAMPASGTREAAVPMVRRELAGLIAFGFVFSGVQWAIFSYTTLYLTEDLGYGHVAAGVGLALSQVLGIAGRLTWGHLSDGPRSRLPALLAIAAGSIACLVVFAIGPGRIGVWPLLAASGFAIVGWNGAFYALVVERAGPGRIGQVSGTVLAWIFGGSVVIPPLAGLLVDVFDSWRPLFVFCAAAVGIAAAALWAGLRNSTYRPLDQEASE